MKKFWLDQDELRLLHDDDFVVTLQKPHIEQFVMFLTV